MQDELGLEWEQLASELALGVLEGEERAEALRLYLAAPAFAEAVDAWRMQLGVLHEITSDQPPPPKIWQAISARMQDDGAADFVVKLNFWRRAAIGSGAMAAAFALAIAMLFTFGAQLPPQPKQEQWAVAKLDGKSGAALAVNYAPSAGQLNIRPVELPASELAHELWLIPADGIPRSLGIIGATGTTRISVPAVLRAYLTDGTVLAVSLEPVADAPHQAPSSTPIATGVISVI